MTYDNSFQVISQTKSKNGIQLNCIAPESNPVDNCMISEMHRYNTAVNSNSFFKEIHSSVTFFFGRNNHNNSTIKNIVES